MAKLTNRQMEVLAERVVDILEEQHKANNAAEQTSQEYIEFESTFSDPLVEKFKEDAKIVEYNAQLVEEYNRQIKLVENEAYEMLPQEARVGNHWSKRIDPKDALASYLKYKKEQRFGKSFDRDKILRRVSADILLAEAGSADELVKNIVDKY